MMVPRYLNYYGNYRPFGSPMLFKFIPLHHNPNNIKILSIEWFYWERDHLKNVDLIILMGKLTPDIE